MPASNELAVSCELVTSHARGVRFAARTGRGVDVGFVLGIDAEALRFLIVDRLASWFEEGIPRPAIE
jgi:hypothetical protein